MVWLMVVIVVATLDQVALCPPAHRPPCAPAPHPLGGSTRPFARPPARPAPARPSPAPPAPAEDQRRRPARPLADRLPAVHDRARLPLLRPRQARRLQAAPQGWQGAVEATAEGERGEPAHQRVRWYGRGTVRFRGRAVCVAAGRLRFARRAAPWCIAFAPAAFAVETCGNVCRERSLIYTIPLHAMRRVAEPPPVQPCMHVDYPYPTSR